VLPGLDPIQPKPYGGFVRGKFRYYPAFGRVMCDGVTLTLENGAATGAGAIGAHTVKKLLEP